MLNGIQEIYRTKFLSVQVRYSRVEKTAAARFSSAGKRRSRTHGYVGRERKMVAPPSFACGAGGRAVAHRRRSFLCVCQGHTNTLSFPHTIPSSSLPHLWSISGGGGGPGRGGCGGDRRLGSRQRRRRLRLQGRPPPPRPPRRPPRPLRRLCPPPPSPLRFTVVVLILC